MKMAKICRVLVLAVLMLVSSGLKSDVEQLS